MSEKAAVIRSSLWTIPYTNDRDGPKKLKHQVSQSMGSKDFVTYKYQKLINSFLFSKCYHQNDLSLIIFRPWITFYTFLNSRSCAWLTLVGSGVHLFHQGKDVIPWWNHPITALQWRTERWPKKTGCVVSKKKRDVIDN